MIANHLTSVEESDANLRKNVDYLRTHSGLASNEYFMPVMGLLFLRHATSRYDEAQVAIETDQATAKILQYPQIQTAFVKRGRYEVPTGEAIARIDGTNSSRQVEL